MSERPLQLRREALATMSPAEIVAAHNTGALHDLLAGRDGDQSETQEAERLLEQIDADQAAGADADLGARGQQGGGQLTREELRQMSPAAIVKAQAEGRCDQVLGR